MVERKELSLDDTVQQSEQELQFAEVGGRGPAGVGGEHGVVCQNGWARKCNCTNLIESA